MIPAALEVLLTQTFEALPLATLRNLPGPDADLTPEQMRGLAAALLAAAEECEQRPIAKRLFRPVVKRYSTMPQRKEMGVAA
jgi:hypothetical protein